MHSKLKQLGTRSMEPTSCLSVQPVHEAQVAWPPHARQAAKRIRHQIVHADRNLAAALCGQPRRLVDGNEVSLVAQQGGAQLCNRRLPRLLVRWRPPLRCVRCSLAAAAVGLLGGGSSLCHSRLGQQQHGPRRQ